MWEKSWWAHHGAGWKESVADPAQVLYGDLDAAVEDLEAEEDGGAVAGADVQLAGERGHGDHGLLQAGHGLQAREASVHVALGEEQREGLL